MKTRSLLISVGVVAILLVALNAVIHQGARTSQRQRMLHLISEISDQTDFVFLGNSLVEAGYDGDAFRSSWRGTNAAIKPVNLALGATSPVEHYLILDRALRRPLHLKYLVYGFFDDQLNAQVRGDWEELVGNRALSYYFPEQAAEFYRPRWLKRWQLWLTGHIPMLAERSSLWSKVERLRWRIDETGMPARPTNRFGRVEDFKALEAGDRASFQQRCAALLKANTGFSAPIRRLLGLARQNGAKVILVEMPMPSAHRTTYYGTASWSELRSYVRSLAEKEGATYIDAADWVDEDAYFEDATHLNPRGAQVFSAKLAGVLSTVAAASTSSPGFADAPSREPVTP